MRSDRVLVWQAGGGVCAEVDVCACGGRLRTVLRRRGFLRGRWDEAGGVRMESSGFVEIGLVQAGLAGGVP